MKKLLRLAFLALAVKVALVVIQNMRSTVTQPAGGPFEPAPSPTPADPRSEPRADAAGDGTPTPEPEAEPEPEPDPGPPDDLTMLTGVGPVYAERLNALGIENFRALEAANTERIATGLQLSRRAVASWQTQAGEFDG